MSAFPSTTPLPLLIGIDLGGTQLRVAAVTQSGTLASQVYAVPTGTSFSAAALTRHLQLARAQILNETNPVSLSGWGLGITGIIAHRRLTQSDFLPLLNDVDLVSLTAALAGATVPVALENDARCFVYAEAQFGAARGARDVFGITLGTGLGGGLLVNGQLVHGAHGAAGEICEVPLRGIRIEDFLSGHGLRRGYQAAGGALTADVTSATIAERARQGDHAAQNAWRSYGDDLCSLCETAVALFDPAVIVIGGSMAQARDLFGERFHAYQRRGRPTVTWAALGTNAGLIGAAALSLTPAAARDASTVAVKRGDTL